MARELWLGIDVGTSSVKAVVSDSDGAVLGRGHRPYPTRHPGPARAEQDPQEWWEALSGAVRQAVTRAGGNPLEVKALAMTTQGGTLVPVDASGSAVHPAVVWTDTRCAKQSEVMSRSLPKDYVYNTTGWPLAENLNLLQIQWLRENNPEVFASTPRFLSVHDYLTLKMCGLAVLDMSNAGINQLANLRQNAWDDGLLSQVGITSESLGLIRPAGEVIGQLLPGAAEALGLDPGTLVVNGTHDQYCVAYGVGARKPGDIFIGSGTAWVVGVIEQDLTKAFGQGKCVSRAALPGSVGSLISLEAGGASLEWWRAACSNRGQEPSWAEVDEVVAGEYLTDPEALPIYLPYLYGNTYPTNQPGLRGVLWGLQANHGFHAVAAAIMLGVSAQTAWMLESFPQSDGPLTLVGGAAHSRPWSQYLANTTGKEVLAAEEPDVGALGASMLAARALLGREIGGGAVSAARFRPSSDRKAWERVNEKFRNLSAMAAGAHRLEQEKSATE